MIFCITLKFLYGTYECYRGTTPFYQKLQTNVTINMILRGGKMGWWVNPKYDPSDLPPD